MSGRAATDRENVSLDDLTTFVEQQLKGQTFTFFGSGLQHAKQIALVRATEFASISTKLNDATELLNAGEPTALFRAITALRTVQSKTGRNKQAIALKNAIDERLSAERQMVVYYLTVKKLDLLDNCPRTCARIETLLSNISFGTLVAPEQEQVILPLTLGLWEASRRPDDDGLYKAWLTQMCAVEKYLTEPPRVAKSEKPGVARSEKPGGRAGA